MVIEVDHASEVPPYEQIRVQIRAMVRRGDLQTGDRLPSIRQLAGDLGVATGTVARAYRELETDGVVATRGARGTTVLEATEADELLTAADGLVDAALDSGSALEDAITALRIAFATRRAET